MKTLFQIIGVITFIFVAGACKSSPDAHNSHNSIDWKGTYKGTYSDGEKEMVAVVMLQDDMSYSMQVAVTGNVDEATELNGNFSWNNAGSEITLKDSKTGDKTIFKVKENALEKTNGGVSFIMEKIQKESITEKYWKLIEINGKPVVWNESARREPFIILREEGRRVNGNGGCNSLMGGYEIIQPNKIKFSQMASTMMACIDMDIETELKKALENADNYTLSADGKYLSLNREPMAPLAKFEVIYLR